MKTKVLVVDDSDDVRLILGKVLARLGYEAISCADAESAFEIVKAQRPAVMLTDVFLGATNGLDLVTRVRSDLAPPLPSMIAMSGMPEVEREALSRGVKVFLPKPLTAEVLREALETVLAERPVESRLVTSARNVSGNARAAAREAARAAGARLAPFLPELRRRAVWTVEWLPAYLGFGRAALTVVGELGLDETLSSNETETDALHSPARRTLESHVVETGSVIVLDDAAAFVSDAAGDGHEPLHFFAGVPLLAGAVSIGALCVADGVRRTLDPEDYDLIVALGRRASGTLGGDTESSTPIFWDARGFLTPEAFELLVAMALRRARRTGGAIEILIAEMSRPFERSDWMDRLRGLVSLERVAVARRPDGRFGLLLSRSSPELARADLQTLLLALGDRDALVGAGWLSIDAAGLPSMNERELIHMAEAIVCREQGAGMAPRREGIAIRRENKGAL